MYKKLTCYVLCFVLLLGLYCSPTTVHAAYFMELPSRRCESFAIMASKQLSGILRDVTYTDVSITSDDKYKDYGYRVNFPTDVYATVYAFFESVPYWNWQVSVYTDATCNNLVPGSGNDYANTQTEMSFTSMLPAGDYYVVVRLKYNGSSMKPDNADYNVTYDAKLEKYTIANRLSVGIAYVNPADCVTVKTSALNGVTTVVVDASNYVENASVYGPPYIQYQIDEEDEIDYDSYDDPTIWDLKRENWGTSNVVSEKVQHVVRSGLGTSCKSTFYLKKSGNYVFRIAQPTTSVSNYNAIIYKTFIDCDMPEITGVKDGKFYKKDVKISYKDNGKLSYALLNGKFFPSGKKITANGDYCLEIEDAAGNLTTCNFTIDKKAPTISGAKNGKTYKSKRSIKIKDTGSGVKRLKLKAVMSNGSVYTRDISSAIDGDEAVSNALSYNLTQSGKYYIEVWDKAGNKTKTVFTIKL